MAGRLFLYDGLSFSTRVIKLRPKQASCSVCGDNPSVTQLIDYNQFCGSQADDKSHSINVSYLLLQTCIQPLNQSFCLISSHIRLSAFVLNYQVFPPAYHLPSQEMISKHGHGLFSKLDPSIEFIA